MTRFRAHLGLGLACRIFDNRHNLGLVVDLTNSMPFGVLGCLSIFIQMGAGLEMIF